MENPKSRGDRRHLDANQSRLQNKFSHENLVFNYALLAGVPALVAVIVLLIASAASPKLILTVAVLVVPPWLAFAWAARGRVVHSLQILSNILAAVRESDFSLRARGSGRKDALHEVTRELNLLSQHLQRTRFGEVEASALLATVIREIDVAIFAFDADEKLQFANPAGQRLLGREHENISSFPAVELGLEECLKGSSDRVLNYTFATVTGRWGLRRRTFREGGKPHHLLVISDLSRTLREEERLAWQRLVRVLGHELNNSLAPIKSLAGSLRSLLAAEPRSEDWEQDMGTGLEIVETRAEGLRRFLDGYARLARLPPPVLRENRIDTIIRRVALLETRIEVQVSNGPENVVVRVDTTQIEQATINLIRNATDAALARRTEGVLDAGVRISWETTPTQVIMLIEDDGHGISNTANLFVPFFTTKPAGSGIGLILARQVAEAHSGNLSLQNRPHATGAVATLTLPRVDVE